jgi:5-methylcytosine-specific restriction endonuclease McrA
MEQEDLKTEKLCTICKQVKPIIEFYKDAQRRDGHYTKCKSCHAKLVKNWQTANSERFLDATKKWKREHKKERAEQVRKLAHKYPDRVHANAKRSRERHPETSRNWRKNNKDKTRNYSATRKARLAGNGGDLTVEEWYAILDFYGYKCLCCGRDDVKLTIDHVIPIFNGGRHSADNVQPLCGPCNSRKKDKHIDYRKEKYHAPSSY